MVDQDAAQSPVADDAGRRPYLGVDAVQDGEHASGRPAVVGEEPSDVIGLDRSVLQLGYVDWSSPW